MLRTIARAGRLASQAAHNPLIVRTTIPRTPRHTLLRPEPLSQAYRALSGTPPTRFWSDEESPASSTTGDGHETRNYISQTHWPVTKVNTLLNICPEGACMLIERLGSLSRVEKSGWFLAVPFLDRIAYTVDMRERTLFYPPQSAVTKDNVNVKVGAVLFVQFKDPVKAAYGATDPLRAVTEFAKSAMRATVGELELDSVFHSRKLVNERCCNAIEEGASNWGMTVTRHEILDVTPDKFISESLDRQAAAERMRREKVLQAEGEKQAAALESEGVKTRLRNESEGHLIRVRNEALAEQTRIEREAEGEARSITLRAEAQAQALATVTAALSQTGASDAARLELARSYIDMYGQMAQGSNTIMINEKPADVPALVAQAALALDAVHGAKVNDGAVQDTPVEVSNLEQVLRGATMTAKKEATLRTGEVMDAQT